MAHIAALRTFPDGPPVGVTVFVEGEEEIGSDSLLTILERHGERLRADAIVLADSGNWDIGEPALTVTLRGLIRVVVTITTLDHGVHSGMFGGAVPDAITTLIRLIATLHDADGNLTVEGLKSGEASDLDYDEKRLPPRVRAARRCRDHRLGHHPHPALEQAGADDHRVQRAQRREVLQHPRALRLGQAVDADRAGRGHPGRLRAAHGPPREAPAVGRPDGDPPRRRGPRLRRRRRRSRLRPGPGRVHRRVGRSSRSTSAPAGRSRSSHGSPRSSPTRRSS